MQDESSIPKIENHLAYTVNPETLLDSPQQHSDLSTSVPTVLDPQLISVCACLLSGSTESLEDTDVSKRKRNRYSRVVRTETYLRERRIPELIRFILAKTMCCKPSNPSIYVAELLDECMIFRSGLGKAPVLFEERHIEAVLKSFDLGDRGWLSAGQVRRAYTTLGLTPKTDLEDRTPTEEVLGLLRKTQESELLSLLTAGSEMEMEFFE